MQFVQKGKKTLQLKKPQKKGIVKTKDQQPCLKRQTRRVWMEKSMYSVWGCFSSITRQ